jgi:uroporphyrinogen III methyltransferase/synthase
MLMKPGKVYLIGAGPGDPKLITLRGVECIQQSDVVIYDYLANDQLLKHARADAEIIYAGKRKGSQTISQEKINRLLVHHAKKGKAVARLKGGDPFIFGRGGEEALALSAAKVPFEVVPGVTSAVAVPAYAGIPLTHRDFAATVVLATGHGDIAKRGSQGGSQGDSHVGNVPWEHIAPLGTLVFFMGMTNLAGIAAQLVRHGRNPKTPVALIRWGTKSNQKTLVGTLKDIVAKAKSYELKPPGLIIIGEVVRLREKLNWFETRPLFGKKVLITRTQEQASFFSELLIENGAEPVECATIEVIPPDNWAPLDRAIRDLPKYRWLIFTSVNGVRFFLERLKTLGRDLRVLKGISLCTIGPATAAELQRVGITPDFMPAEYRAEAIVKGLGQKKLRGSCILLPRAKVAREILPRELTKLGSRVDVVPVYQTVRPDRDLDRVESLLRNGEIDVATFTSSSTVKNFVDMLGHKEVPSLLKNVVVACIGPITAKTAKEFGIQPRIMPKAYTIPALTDAIVDYFRDRPSKRPRTGW